MLLRGAHTARVLVLMGLVAGALALGRPAPAAAQTLYTEDGEPTGLEEEIRWRVNRGRFDTVSENQLRGSSYTDVPATAGPLAPNQKLALAARHHSEDMAKQNVFKHETVVGSAYYNPVTQSNFWDRITAEGYVWNGIAENIAAGHVGGQRREVELDVRRRRLGKRAAEEPPLVDADGQRPGLEQQPLQADLRAPEDAAQLVVGGDGLPALEDHPRLQVILQVGADAWQIVDDRNPLLPQVCGGADAGELQQLRRMQGTRCRDHFAHKHCKRTPQPSIRR